MLKVTPGMQISKEALHKQVVPSTVVKDSWAHLMLMANLLGHKIHLKYCWCWRVLSGLDSRNVEMQ